MLSFIEKLYFFYVANFGGLLDKNLRGDIGKNLRVYTPIGVLLDETKKEELCIMGKNFICRQS